MYWTLGIRRHRLAVMNRTTIAAFPGPCHACATQDPHEGHGGHARLGKVNFAVECDAAAQRLLT